VQRQVHARSEAVGVSQGFSQVAQDEMRVNHAKLELYRSDFSAAEQCGPIQGLCVPMSSVPGD
jgi:hypothetical protein